MKRNFAAFLPIFGLTTLLVAFGVRLMTNETKSLPSAMIDRLAPWIDLQSLREGETPLTTTEIQALAAKAPLLLNVFASWCAPCRVEHPFLMELKRQGVTILAINLRDKPENAKSFLATLGNPYARIGMDADGSASIEWGIYGVPETFVLDRTGKIRYRHVGPIDARALEKIIRPLLKNLGS